MAKQVVVIPPLALGENATLMHINKEGTPVFRPLAGRMEPGPDGDVMFTLEPEIYTTPELGQKMAVGHVTHAGLGEWFTIMEVLDPRPSNNSGAWRLRCRQ